MRLVWTYDSASKDLTETERITLVNYYILSINSASKLGYQTVMVCRESDYNFWKQYVNEIHICNCYENSPLWDSFKIYALETLRGEYYLIDGDVILHNNLPEINDDILFDSYEILNWSNEYQPTIDKLTKLGIGDVIRIWDNKRIPIMNCGVLSINNQIVKTLYMNLWKRFNQFVINNISEIDTKFATGVGAQYLLSLISNQYNIPSTKLTENLGDISEYYQHYYGSQKYITPIVPTDHILTTNSNIKLF
jgi:hypothetical protein